MHHLKDVAVLVGVKLGPVAKTQGSARPSPRTPSSAVVVHQSAPASFAAFVSLRRHSAQKTASS